MNGFVFLTCGLPEEYIKGLGGYLEKSNTASIEDFIFKAISVHVKAGEGKTLNHDDIVIATRQDFIRAKDGKVEQRFRMALSGECVEPVCDAIERQKGSRNRERTSMWLRACCDAYIDFLDEATLGVVQEIRADSDFLTRFIPALALKIA